MDNSEKLTARIQRLEAAVDRYRDATVPQLRDLWAVRDERAAVELPPSLATQIYALEQRIIALEKKVP